MNRMEKGNYYELLGVMPGATKDEIDDAFNQAKSLYGKGSAALYSLFSPEEREKRLEIIVEAYNTLSDPAKRHAYDAGLADPAAKGVTGAVEKGGKGLPADRYGIRFDFAGKLTVMEGGDPFAADQYRILYTKLEKISLERSLRAFAVTSAVKGEGKSVTSVNLSYIMACEFKKRVILVECDLKNPSISGYLKDSGRNRGLVDLLSGEAELETAAGRIGDSSLYILPAGRAVKNSSELLSSAGMKAVMERLKREFDYVIVDSTPIHPLADMNILSAIVDGMVLVVRANMTPKDIVLKAVGSISGGNMVGIVLNDADVRNKKYYYY